MSNRGFTSDILRAIYREAGKQGWRIEVQRKSGHAYAYCPKEGCGFREAFSLSAKGYRHEVNAKVSNLRKHGFIWKGRGGDHTAELLGEQHLEPEES